MTMMYCVTLRVELQQNVKPRLMQVKHSAHGLAISLIFIFIVVWFIRFVFIATARMGLILIGFIRYKPTEYRLLDFRRNIMKNLILGDCGQLIKFILFGDKSDNNRKKFITRHIPRSILWQKSREFVEDDDLKPFEEECKSNERDKITNDMELAIYHCKG